MSVPHVPKNDRAVRETLHAWRRLTSGRRGSGTLVALSGGADSTALSLILARLAPKSRIVLGHVMHDMRSPDVALADRDACRALAEHLELAFVEGAVHVREQPGNLEANARRERYRALAGLAQRLDLPYIATAHHAGDQLESVLMGLMRGAGPGGLRGVRAKRPIGLAASRLSLIRPMLGLPATESRRICVLAGVQWQEDLTNQDTRRLRAALRAEIVPRLLALRPGCDQRIAHTARLCGEADDLVTTEAARLLSDVTVAAPRPGTMLLHRPPLHDKPPLVVARLLTLAYSRVVGLHKQDQIRARSLAEAVRVIQDEHLDPRELAIARMRIRVRAREFELACEEGRT
ncbi:MAG: tRNA lysidine(34) synthetase TilS [Phycisphaerales bacterium]|nr:tRNA lysidine(34) synthetase TilS [Phycisphaerales bacterium]